ncbi:50S ribosomal protein L9 [Candidatus Pantoea edessiphila]|uniref:Large ribosomal subunit protein bL9 n=1 Tax=Candidatus Pantoea edessiphila TaxID=2044610 RepID=A0A2P5SZQ0_9GAMM|nr:50S ribosomal protein L9 [Candidatus Pantoea edessiphila]PPI87818.1 50S ribosomal protein L9 [Candidatus Pantoea edessiphila]
MKIIILDKIKKLGDIGDIINVKSGYARNFLVPKGKAILATKKNISSFEEHSKQMKDKITKNAMMANNRAEKINQLGSITIISKAGKKGKLFGSVGARNIADAITSAGIKVNKNEVRLPNGVLRTVGQHEVCFHLYNEIFAKLIVNIIDCQ